MLRRLMKVAKRILRRSYRANPSQYWEQRHQRKGLDLEGVGKLGLGHEANSIDYDAKWREIEPLLQAHVVNGGSTALDAGCGTGYFSERLVQKGFTVTGVDFSPEAVNLAAQKGIEGAQFEVGNLADLRHGPFHLVTCVDVLFHVVDPDEWVASVSSLAACVGQNGWLLIQESLVESPDRRGVHDHVLWRSLEQYQEVLGDQFGLMVTHRYELPASGDPKDLLLWQRRRG